MKFHFFLILLFGLPKCLLGQGHESHHQLKDSTFQNQVPNSRPESHNHKDTAAMQMSSAFSRNLPMNVNGSGTSWQPENSPMYMNMFHKGNWNFMLHYGIFLTYTNQNVNRTSYQRGESYIYSPNWVMLMVNKNVGQNGLLTLRGMFSGDPFTIGGAGYPLLFQSGETWKDSALIDHQHPHDLISELAIGYTHSFTKKTDLYLYIGIPGEPSIGPPAFMHRPSSLNLSFAPLGHHWQDATHITFGVATVGFRYNKFKLEASSFTGREPNENRYNFDKLRFNSYSARLSIIPIKSISAQVSYAYIKSPEALSPENNINRFTASILHNYWFNDASVISTSLVWGMNKNLTKENVSTNQSILLESNLQAKRYTYTTRVEWVQKNHHELGLSEQDEHNNYNIGAWYLSTSRYLIKSRYYWVDLGAVASFYIFSKELQPYYGKRPYSLQLFLRIIPPRMKKNP